MWNHNGTPIVVDYLDYDYTPDDQAQGRWPSGEGEMFTMTSPTPEAFNSGPALGQIIINELHYNPADPDNSDFEFIEIFNRGPSTVNLWENYGGTDYPWEIEGFEFAVGTTLASNEVLVIVPFNPVTRPVKLNDFKTRYDLLASSVQIVGGYGSLDNGGEMIRLQRPLPAPAADPLLTPYETVDAVRYDDEAPWPASAVGDGDSIHLVSVD